jgi:hypothetical protein
MIISYEGVNFNAEWASKKTEAEFIAHEKHHLQSKDNPEGLTETQLKEAYKLAVEAMKPKVVSIHEKPTEKASDKTS